MQQGTTTALASQIGQRAGIISINVFLIVGTLLLLFVNERRARLAAEQYQPAAD
ncbi:MAG: hypothetical protein JXB30_04890 [Anaerolineae bacterium]|nr:hypothetical protein [Anaerolineae bacterium]